MRYTCKCTGNTITNTFSSTDYSDWDSTDEEEEEEEEEEDDDEEIEIENPVKSGLVKKHPEGSVPTPLVPLVSSVPSKDENKKSLGEL